MRGRIKFVDGNTNQWGFIIPDDDGADIHFRVSNIVKSDRPTRADSDCRVEFDLAENGDRREATNIKLLESPSTESTAGPSSKPTIGQPGHALANWAFIPYDLPLTRDGTQYISAFHLLADTALEEGWHFGKEPDRRQPYPILVNYLQYTFYRLQKEGKVLETEQWATFNTGLVDRLYDPIYTLVTKNDRSVPPWKFHDFCIPGKGSSGKKLTSEFSPLPEPAKRLRVNKRSNVL